jgi:hypothetical protein
MLLLEVRTRLLAEAQQSPDLLSDLAGLEEYVAESYHARSFAELIQNADDARASRFRVERAGEHILVANDGRVFTRADFESLCRSAHSSKMRGTSIGYRGIGFKSVVRVARRIHVFSGALEATFSRERTARDIPQAKRVPLVRIPHPVCTEERQPFDRHLQRVLDEGYTTVFVFGDLITTEIESEFAAFDFTSLLFLRNVRQVDLQDGAEESARLQRHVVNEGTQQVTLVGSRATTSWTLMAEGDVTLAFARDHSGVRRLDERQAVVHAFLPTEEPTGLGIKINGDIGTDPSRRQVILDERTAAATHRISQLIVHVIRLCLTDSVHVPSPTGILSALAPSVDPRFLAFKRPSFGSQLLDAMQRAAGTSFENLRCRPSWLNAVDFDQLAHRAGLWHLQRDLADIDGLVALVRFLGAAEASLDELSEALVSHSPSLSGCVDVVVYLAGNYLTGQIDLRDISPDWRIWPVGESVYSLKEAATIGESLNSTFVDMLSERTASALEVRRLMQDLTDLSVAQILLPTDDESTLDGTVGRSPELRQLPLSLQKWRSAEQQVLALLNAEGYTVSDVSRQNLGYDLEGTTPQGQPIFIEVKSIDYAGQTLTLTSNEIAVARDKGEAYFLAIVQQGAESLEVALIGDPANQLETTRRCRQWAWECSSYDFRPKTYRIE